MKVTLSENLQEYVWVAEIQQGTSPLVTELVSLPRPETAINLQSSPPLSIHIVPLISRPEPILDVVILEGNPRRLFALGAEQIVSHEFNDGRWVSGEALTIQHVRPFPRDLRGRLVLRKDHLFDAYLPGVVCHSGNSVPLVMNCAASEDPWPLQPEEFVQAGFFAPARNFFTGALAPGIGQQKAAPPFYSAAAIPRGKYVLWSFAGVDGQLHLLDGLTQLTSRARWGSDIAGVHAGCSQTRQVLATSAEDEEGDSLQVFEFPDREPVAVSQRVAVNGRITALWPAPSGEKAIAAYRDAATGNYEAVEISLACSQ